MGTKLVRHTHSTKLDLATDTILDFEEGSSPFNIIGKGRNRGI